MRLLAKTARIFGLTIFSGALASCATTAGSQLNQMTSRFQNLETDRLACIAALNDSSFAKDLSGLVQLFERDIDISVYTLDQPIAADLLSKIQTYNAGELECLANGVNGTNGDSAESAEKVLIEYSRGLKQGYERIENSISNSQLSVSLGEYNTWIKQLVSLRDELAVAGYKRDAESLRSERDRQIASDLERFNLVMSSFANNSSGPSRRSFGCPSRNGAPYSSTIDGTFNGWDGESVYKLTNGEVWKQSKYSYSYSNSYRPKVTIFWESRSWKMKVDGSKQAVEVECFK